VREWVTDTSTTLKNLKAFTIDFDVDLHDMDCRLRATFSRAILQWLLEASTEVLIIAFMTTGSSSAHGSSFHDNGDGNDNKRSFVTPGKRKSNRDDDDDNDDGTSKGTQTASMTPKDRCKGWCGHTTSWHRELVGSELQSVLQANHPQHAQAVCSGNKDFTKPDALA
jgi:hypothetical protein